MEDKSLSKETQEKLEEFLLSIEILDTDTTEDIVDVMINLEHKEDHKKEFIQRIVDFVRWVHKKERTKEEIEERANLIFAEGEYQIARGVAHLLSVLDKDNKDKAFEFLNSIRLGD